MSPPKVRVRRPYVVVHVGTRFRGSRSTEIPCAIDDLGDRGLLWSIENTEIMLHQFAKVQVGELGFPGRFFFAKVRVAGSIPVVRSKERPGSGGARGLKSPLSWHVRRCHAPHPHHIFPEFLGRRGVDPYFSVRVAVRILTLSFTTLGFLARNLDQGARSRDGR